MRLPRLPAFLALLLTALPLVGCSNEPLDTAPNVDLSRFQGRWYEIAKLPRPTQANCKGTQAFYTLRGQGLDVVNQCHLDRLDGELKQRNARAEVTDSSAKLSIDVGGFTGDYWILEVGEHYEHAVIGVPSRDYLWILSRTPTLDEKTFTSLVQRAHDAKFDTSRLERTEQGE
ncbi:MAG: lipocalin family protein [Minicystis sp.]